MNYDGRFGAAILVSLLVLNGCGGGDGSGDVATRIELRSDPSLIFTGSGQTARLSAALLDDNGEELDGDLAWTSSNPDAISVSPDGVATARTNLGSAMITVASGDVHAVSSAVVVALQPDTVLVRSDDVLDVTDNAIRLPTSITVEEGQIVLNGGQPGFLARVVRIEARGQEQVLTTTEATIVDAVREMDATLQSATHTLVPELENPDGTAQKSLRPECDLKSSAITVELANFIVDPVMSVSTDVVVRISNGELQRLELALETEFGIRVGVDAIKLAGALKGSVQCDWKLKTIPIAPLPILGPIGIAASVTPVPGIELGVEYTYSELEISGLEAKAGVKARAGVVYDRATGFGLIDDFDATAPTVTMKSAKRAPEDKLTVKVEPFFALNSNISGIVGPFSLVDFGLVQAKALLGYELSMTTPVSPDERAYRGPRWMLYTGAEANLDPLFDEIELFNTFLSVFGLGGADDLLSFSAKLYERKWPLLESPDPTVQLSRTLVQPESNINFTYAGLGDEGLRKLEAVVWKDGMRVLADLETDGSGEERFMWTPTIEDEGRYFAGVRLYDGIFSDIGLPYASEVVPEFEVEPCDLANCDDPLPTPNECQMVDDETGYLVYVDGAMLVEETSITIVSTDPQGEQGVAVDRRSTVTWVYSTDTGWAFDRREVDNVAGTSTSASSETSALQPAVRPRCNQADGTVFGPSGTEVLVSEAANGSGTTTTRTWSSDGCNYWFAPDRMWECELVGDTYRLVEVDP